MTGFASETSALGTALAEISAPILGVVAAVGVLIAAFMTLWNTNEEFRNSVLEIWNSVRSSFSDMCSRIVEAVNSLGFEFSNITEVIKGVWQGLCDFLGPPIILALTLIQESLSAAFDLIASVVEFFCALFSGDWQGMCDALVSILEATGRAAFWQLEYDFREDFEHCYSHFEQSNKYFREDSQHHFDEGKCGEADGSICV